MEPIYASFEACSLRDSFPRKNGKSCNTNAYSFPINAVLSFPKPNYGTFLAVKNGWVLFPTGPLGTEVGSKIEDIIIATYREPLFGESEMVALIRTILGKHHLASFPTFLTFYQLRNLDNLHCRLAEKVRDFTGPFTIPNYISKTTIRARKLRQESVERRRRHYEIAAPSPPVPAPSPPVKRDREPSLAEFLSYMRDPKRKISSYIGPTQLIFHRQQFLLRQ